VRRVASCLIAITLLVATACSLPDKAHMEGQLPIRLDKGSPNGPNLGCMLSIGQQAATAIKTIQDYHEGNAQQGADINAYFLANPGEMTLWTMNDYQTIAKPWGWKEYLGYGTANGVAGLSTYLSCKSTLDTAQVVTYWCGDVERPMPWNSNPNDNETEVPMFFESGWFICRNGGASNLFITNPATVEQAPAELPASS
jgi:hypothetical protein